MISTEQIISLYMRRRDELAEVNATRARVRDAYNGKMKVTLPDMGRNESAYAANLLKTGIDQYADRAASTLPAIFCPPRDDQVKRELVAAEKRRRILYGWWQRNNLANLAPTRARHLVAYGCSPVLIEPNFELKIPRWRVFDPMGAFPGHVDNPGDPSPEDCAFVFTRPYSWVKSMYPDQFQMLYRKQKYSKDDRLTLVRWVDHEHLVLIVLGHCPDDAVLNYAYPLHMGEGGWNGTARYIELERLPNKAGICPAVVPARLTLDRIQGQMDGMLHLYAQQAHLTALEMIAVEKGIFPDLYLEPDGSGQIPKVVAGPFDGRTGQINVVANGRMREIGTNPGFQTNPAIDRLERAARLEGGIPAEMGGESASNIRTGKRGDAVLSAAVDYPVQHLQKVLASSLREENKRAIAISKAWFGANKLSFYVSWKGAKGQVDYTPREVFTTDENVVEYSHTGTDLNGLTIMVGQLVGMGTMSKQTAAELLPIIEDPEREHDRGIKEALESALLASIQQKVNEGTIAPVDAAWLMTQVGHNKLELAEAVMKLDKRVQERQAAMPDPAMDPMADPSQMAGLATGTPAEAQAVPAAIGAPTESQDNLASLLGRLRQPQMTVPSERPAM